MVTAVYVALFVAMATCLVARANPVLPNDHKEDVMAVLKSIQVNNSFSYHTTSNHKAVLNIVTP